MPKTHCPVAVGYLLCSTNTNCSRLCHAHKFKLPTSHFIYNIINPTSYKCKHMKSVDRWKDKRVRWLKWMGISWAIKAGVVTLKCLKWYVNYEACMGQQMFWWCHLLQTTSHRGGMSRVIRQQFVILQRSDASALHGLFCRIYFITAYRHCKIYLLVYSLSPGGTMCANTCAILTKSHAISVLVYDYW